MLHHRSKNASRSPGDHRFRSKRPLPRFGPDRWSARHEANPALDRPRNGSASPFGATFLPVVTRGSMPSAEGRPSVVDVVVEPRGDEDLAEVVAEHEIVFRELPPAQVVVEVAEHEVDGADPGP